MAQNHVREEMTLLRDAVRDALAARASLDELGVWSTLVAPEGSLALASVVAEELGRGLYPGPAYETTVGELLADELGIDGPAAFITGGTAVEVPTPAVLLIATGDTLARATAAGPVEAPVLDVTRRIVTYTAHTEDLVAQPDTVVRARAARSLLYATDTLGCLEHVLAKTVDYAKQRTTFGAPATVARPRAFAAVAASTVVGNSEITAPEATPASTCSTVVSSWVAIGVPLARKISTTARQFSGTLAASFALSVRSSWKSSSLLPLPSE